MHLEDNEKTFLVINLIEIMTPAIPIPIIIGNITAFFSSSAASPKQVHIRIELFNCAGDEFLEHRIPPAVVPVGVVVVGGVVVVVGDGVETEA